MGISRLCKKCRECELVDTCEHKRMEALAYFSEASSKGEINADASVMQPHDYMDINININTTVAIDIEKLKKKINQQLCSNVFGINN